MLQCVCNYQFRSVFPQCVAACCSVLQCVPMCMEVPIPQCVAAACCSVSQCVAVCSSVLQYVRKSLSRYIVLQYVRKSLSRYIVLQSVSKYLSSYKVLQRVAVRSNVLQHVREYLSRDSVLQCVAVCCSVFWRVAVCEEIPIPQLAVRQFPGLVFVKLF